MSLKIKLKRITTNNLIWLFSIFFLVNSCQFADKFNVYINDDDSGWKAIIFDVKNGEAIVKKEERFEINILNKDFYLASFNRKLGVLTDDTCKIYLKKDELDCQVYPFNNGCSKIQIKKFEAMKLGYGEEKTHRIFIFKINNGGNTSFESKNDFENRIVQFLKEIEAE